MVIFYSDETFREPLSHMKQRHMYGLYKTTAPKGWVFKPTADIAEMELLSIEEIVELMNKEPLRFTAGFLNTFRKYLEYQKLPFRLNDEIFQTAYYSK